MASSMFMARTFEESMSSTVLDRFGGASAWDMFTDWREAYYADQIASKTCLDCGSCTRCEIEGHENIGFCRESGEFVSDADVVADIGCECFIG